MKNRVEAQRHALAQKQTQNQLRDVCVKTVLILSLALKVIFRKLSLKKNSFVKQ